MGIKQRFKKAIFAFFKDEILKSVGYNNPMQHIEIVSREMRFIEIRAEILLTESENYVEPIGIAYERALEKAKKTLFEESMKYIEIETNSVMDSYIYNARGIKVSLFIGQKNN